MRWHGRTGPSGRWWFPTVLLLILSLPIPGVLYPAEGERQNLEAHSPLFRKRLEVALVNLQSAPRRYSYRPLTRGREDQTGSREEGWTPLSLGMSVCALSGCIFSVCTQSGCLGSVCQASGCLSSFCIMSGCATSYCGGSFCVESRCFASACLESSCHTGCGEKDRRQIKY